MIKTMQIDYVRAVLENALMKNAFGNTGFFTDNDIKLFSFYEHLVDEGEVNRYVENYNDLINQQNQSQWVGFGVLTTGSNPTMTNLKSSFISPFEWTCSIRCSLANRDKMVETIYDLIAKYKGKKQEIAELSSGKLLCVGTLGNTTQIETTTSSLHKRPIYDYDFVGSIETGQTLDDILTNLNNDFGFAPTVRTTTIYCEQKINNVWHLKKMTRPLPSGSWVVDTDFDEVGYKKMKVDLSFDEIKIDQPYNLNVSEYCTITFGGSATLCDYKVKLGNDLLGIMVSKIKVKGETDFTFTANKTYLEPMELPSGVSANSVPNLLRSNYFKQNSHTDSLAYTMQYSFVLDESIELLNQWFDYARYGINNLNNGALQDASITPNIIYGIEEWWSSWGVIKKYSFNAKIAEDIDIEETDSDSLTMTITMQIQGDND